MREGPRPTRFPLYFLVRSSIMIALRLLSGEYRCLVLLDSVRDIYVVVVVDDPLFPRYLNKNLNASRPSEHPPFRGKNVKTFSTWHHGLQRQNVFMVFKWVLLSPQKPMYRYTTTASSVLSITAPPAVTN